MSSFQRNSQTVINGIDFFFLGIPNSWSISFLRIRLPCGSRKLPHGAVKLCVVYILPGWHFLYSAINAFTSFLLFLYCFSLWFTPLQTKLSKLAEVPLSSIYKRIYKTHQVTNHFTHLCFSVLKSTPSLSLSSPFFKDEKSAP